MEETCKYCNKIFSDKQQVKKHLRLNRCKKQINNFKNEINEIKENITNNNLKYINELEEKTTLQELTIQNLENDLEKYKVYETIYKEYYNKYNDILDEYKIIKNKNEDYKNKIMSLEKQVELFIIEDNKNKHMIEQIKNNNPDLSFLNKHTPKNKIIEQEEIDDNISVKTDSISVKTDDIIGKIKECNGITDFITTLSFDDLTLDDLLFGNIGISFYLFKKITSSKYPIYIIDNKDKLHNNNFRDNLTLEYTKKYDLITDDNICLGIFNKFLQNFVEEIKKKYNVKYKFYNGLYVLVDKHRNIYNYITLDKKILNDKKMYYLDIHKDIDGEYFIKNIYKSLFEKIKNIIEESEISSVIKQVMITHYSKLGTITKINDPYHQKIIRDLKKRMTDTNYSYLLDTKYKIFSI